MRGLQPAHVAIHGLRRGNDVEVQVVVDRLRIERLRGARHVARGVAEGELRSRRRVAERFDREPVDEQQRAALGKVDERDRMSAVEYARRIVAALAIELDPARRRVVARVSDCERDDAILHREVRMRRVPAQREAGKIDASKSIDTAMRLEGGQSFRQSGEVEAALDAKKRSQTSASSAGGWPRNAWGLAL